MIRTLAVLLSLLVILLSPRAPHSSETNSEPSRAGQPALTTAIGSFTTTPRQLRKQWRLRTARGQHEMRSAAHKEEDNKDKECGDHKDKKHHCCSEPVPKMLSIGKFISLETGKRYLVRHVWLMRCPGAYGCCGSLQEQCAPTETADIEVEIPVENSLGRHQFTYTNETHRFQNHVGCACRRRTHQALANFLARELLALYDAEDALHMVHRICKVVSRKVRKFHRFDTRQHSKRHKAKWKSKPGNGRWKQQAEC